MYLRIFRKLQSILIYQTLAVIILVFLHSVQVGMIFSHLDTHTHRQLEIHRHRLTHTDIYTDTETETETHFHTTHTHTH